jgi:hypothetical protein
VGTWIPVIVAVVSALLAGYYARKTKSVELQAQRLMELERRVAASKSQVFEPLLEAIGEFWARIGRGEDATKWAEKNFVPVFVRFSHWVQVYGSDESVRIVHRYMQALYHDVPSEVTMRLLAELVIAARRELGLPETDIDAVDVMGIRITDIYEDGTPLPWASLPEEELYKHAEWTPPWGDRFAKFPA